MILPFEVLLCLGAAAFYLHDACELLHANELVLERRGNGWRYVSATTGVRLLRRSLFLPNPLRPDRTLYLLAWSPVRQLRKTSLRRLRLFEKQLAGVRVLVLLLLLLLLSLPLVLAVFGSGKMLLALFALYYLTTVAALMVVMCNRRVFGLGWKQLSLLVIECLACPPFAVNLLRKITRHSPLSGAAITLASQRLTREDFCQLSADVCAQIERQLQWLDAGSMRHAELINFREQVRRLAE